MIKYLRKKQWSPYFVGVCIGLLLTFLFANGFMIGVSGSISRAGLLIEKFCCSEHVLKTPYLQKILVDPVIFDWKILFMIGMFFGAMISAKISNNWSKNNTIWERKFGPSKTKRYLVAFIGGTLLIFGARLAGGCTSGHAISGGAQLSLVSWIFMFTVFATAIPFSIFLYRNK